MRPSTPWILKPRPSRSRSMTRPNAVGLDGGCVSVGRSGYSALITAPRATSPRPKAAWSCSDVPTDRPVAARARLPGAGGAGRRGRPPAARVGRTPTHLACEALAPELDPPLVLFLLDPLPDLGAAAGGLDMPQPIARRL